MESTIKVPVKPIVKQFLTVRAGDPYPALANDLYGLIISKHLTPHFEQRFQGSLPGQVNLAVKLPKIYSNYFLKASDAPRLSLQIEKLFWKDAKVDIFTSLINKRNKSEAMRKFYNRYQITEEMYTQDNFYRQMTRQEIPSAELRLSHLKKPMFNCVSDEDALSIAGLFFQQDISCRQIANIFGIHHKTVSRIVLKLEPKFKK